MKGTLSLFVFLLAAAVVHAQMQGPAQINEWIEQYGSSTIYGLGISTFEPASEALQQASLLARERLAAQVEIQVTSMTQEFVQRAELNGKTESILFFQTVTRELVDQTLRGVKTFGPFTMKKGPTYVIVYLDRKRFQREFNALAVGALDKQEDDLDRMLKRK